MTRSMTMTRCCSVLLAMLTLGSIPAVAANNLGNVLRESGWDRIIGTWVDAETKGAKNKITYAWRFKNQVIEATSQERHKKNLSLMGHNPRRGEVFHVSVDDQGGSSIGKWTFKKDEATLGLGFVTGTGEEGVLQIRYKLADDDTMIVTVDLPEPIVIKMIRVKEDPKKREAEKKEDEEVENPFE